jgi:diaminohydroxyphosphoribosylaminopyrimidine deaminase / 5-amino-6-(5-phosphoribosylamino)uracil reductase
MQRCLEIASGRLGTVAPNPMVGAIIVCEGQVIGEGFHREFGQAHAEVNAINAVKDKKNLIKSTLYVNLEPCAHMGKTPPCCDLIIEKGISKVVVGTIDPNSVVAGKGIKKLQKKGVEVICGILERECRELNKRFFTFHEKHMPYIILKWAQTRDGFIDKIRKSGEPIGVNWISNPLSRTLVHRWRSQEQAIMVGTNTVIIDNPNLNVRFWQGQSPVRIILDRNLRIPITANILNNQSPTIIYNAKKTQKVRGNEFIQIDFEKDELIQIFSDLYHRQISSVIVEGGKELLESLINVGLWDEARIFIGNKTFREGIKAPEIKMDFRTENLLNDKIQYYRNY